jgi:hypothetical protein
MAIDAIVGMKRLSDAGSAAKTYQAAPQPGLNVQQNDEPVSVSIQRSSTTKGRLTANEQKPDGKKYSNYLRRTHHDIRCCQRNEGNPARLLNYPPFSAGYERKEILIAMLPCERKLSA